MPKEKRGAVSGPGGSKRTPQCLGLSGLPREAELEWVFHQLLQACVELVQR